ncbi:hypothetical protein DM02DRAFT_6930 [Periconia macrospinosa]|uniref:RING-type domain-containing protein n=1 Tax=Periconia macrospinosa TaxID=97972 RepID=A0A2V1EGC8_9PLEO|nr:hypothetical protein DM02DRAFT_6930 [Periconia macrospinosa]
MGECQCCYEEFPLRCMVHCDGDKVHFFCMSCAKTYVEGEMGLGRCKPVCFADSNCLGTFTRKQLRQFLGEKSFDRLDHMVQQQELAAAGLDFLSDCPFCDFKAECRPIEVDKEFRCENPKCLKTSCRLCQNETHVPLTCEERKQEHKLAVRHVVEEAMSEALIRHCNRCRHPFIKEEGCNRMTCTRCGNVQCYVCSKDVKDYKHFSDGQPSTQSNGCPLHDNMRARHKEEVKRAAEKAKAKVRSENPEVTEQDLAISVSGRIRNGG